MTWYNYGKSRNKFSAKSTEYNGEVFHSKLEAGYAQELDIRMAAKNIKGYRRQVKISFDICSKCLRLCSEQCDKHPKETRHHLSNYYIDFVVDENDGTETYTEIKGFETQVWRDKWKLLTILYENDETKKLVVIK